MPENIPVHLPVFAVCGYSGAGKTTLLEKLIPILRARGLAVAVVKSDAHGLHVDRPGKDSDRLFHAGAEVLLTGPDQTFIRRHASSPCRGVASQRPASQGVARSGELSHFAELAGRCDLVLLEGHKNGPFRKVWLTDAADTPPPALSNLAAVLPWDSDRLSALLELIEGFLAEAARATPLFGGVLIGGASSRMGRAKHLLPLGRTTWLEHTLAVLQTFCQQTVILGSGQLPASLAEQPRLPDCPGLTGPIAGLLAGLRWAPGTNWLLAACDHPGLSPDALKWLLEQRQAGFWAVQPRKHPGAPAEPLLAWYGYRMGAVLEEAVAGGNLSLRDLGQGLRCLNPLIPPELQAAWCDIDSPPSP